MAKKKYTVLSRIEGLSDKPLKEGDTVELADDVAAPLLAGLAVAPFKEPVKATPNKETHAGDGEKGKA